MTPDPDMIMFDNNVVYFTTTFVLCASFFSAAAASYLMGRDAEKTNYHRIAGVCYFISGLCVVLGLCTMAMF
jgi:hypothetical protein